MRTSSVTETTAAATARHEAALWVSIAERWHPDRNAEIWADVPAVEDRVISGVDASFDLDRRARRWGHTLERHDLSEIALFAAALATTEAEAWETGERTVATQAFEDRRFLAADRVLPWAVPWLLAVARCFPENRDDADAAAEALLSLGEQHRMAPYLADGEGLHPPGHDGYGPADQPHELGNRIGTLWGGMVVFDRSIQSITGLDLGRDQVNESDAGTEAALAAWYDVSAARWETLAAQYPGTAAYWVDLARRSLLTVGIAHRS